MKYFLHDCNSFDDEKIQEIYDMQELADFLHMSVVIAQKIKNSDTIRYTKTQRKLFFNTLQIIENLIKKGRVK